MANRKNTFLLKRSNVPNKVPQISDLQIGEVAVNAADAKAYTLFTSGTTGGTEVRQIGWDKVSKTGDTMTGDLLYQGDYWSVVTDDYSKGLVFDNLNNEMFMYNSGSTLQMTTTDATIIFPFGSQGLKYNQNFSSDYTDRSLVDKGYVTSAITSGLSTINLSNYLPLSGGTMTGDINIDGNLSIVYEDILYKDSVIFTGSGVKLESRIPDGSIITDLTVEASSIVVNSNNFTFAGIAYTDDFSANYTNRSLVDKGYVTSAITSGLSTVNLSNYLPLSGGTYTGVTMDFRLQDNSLVQRANLYMDRNGGGFYSEGGDADVVNSLYLPGGSSPAQLYVTDQNTLDITSLKVGNGNIIIESSLTGFTGVVYNIDYSTNYTNRSLVDKEYVFNNFINKTGDTVNGNLTVTGTVSATTYLNLPIDITVTGGTFSNGTATFTNNTGGTFNVSGFTTGGTGSDTYVTGFTYDNQNNLTINQNQEQQPLLVNISVLSGLTINGDLNVTGTTNLKTVTANTISNVDYFQFNTGYTGNTVVEGRMYWDEPNGTVSLGMHGGEVSHQIGLEYYYYIKNQSGATIENGRVVRAAGTLSSSSRILGEYMIADGSVPSKYTLGIATENIIDGEDGYVAEFGLVRNIDTTGSLYGETWSDGDILWVSPTISGGLTNVEPQAPNLKIEMAIVVYANANGSIFVRPHRYPYLRDIQDVNISSVTNNDVLSYNTTISAWTNTNQLVLNSLSASSISANTYFSGTTNIEDIFLQKTNLDFGFDGTYSTTSTSFSQIPISIIINSGNTYLNNSTGLTATLYCDVSQSTVGVNGEFQLFNLTDGVELTGTTTTFTSTDIIKASNQFTIANANLNKTYRIRIRRVTGVGANNVSVRAAQLIIDF